MSSPSMFLRWVYGCREKSGYGATPGDTFWLGYRDYDQPFPCPNGLGIDTREPSECEHWRARIDKAKRDIREHQYWASVQNVAVTFTDEEILKELEIIRSWANSLRMQAQPQTGSVVLTRTGQH